jgi:hypothetical protein
MLVQLKICELWSKCTSLNNIHDHILVHEKFEVMGVADWGPVYKHVIKSFILGQEYIIDEAVETYEYMNSDSESILFWLQKMKGHPV